MLTYVHLSAANSLTYLTNLDYREKTPVQGVHRLSLGSAPVLRDPLRVSGTDNGRIFKGVHVSGSRAVLHFHTGFVLKTYLSS